MLSQVSRFPATYIYNMLNEISSLHDRSYVKLPYIKTHHRSQRTGIPNKIPRANRRMQVRVHQADNILYSKMMRRLFKVLIKTR